MHSGQDSILECRPDTQHRGNEGNCLHAPGLCLFAPVEIYNFSLSGGPNPPYVQVRAVYLQKRGQDFGIRTW